MIGFTCDVISGKTVSISIHPLTVLTTTSILHTHYRDHREWWYGNVHGSKGISQICGAQICFT